MRKTARGLPVIRVGDIQSPNENRLHFLSLLFLLSLLILSGCSMVSGKRRADGSLVVTSWRLLWKSEAIQFSAADTNFNAALAIGKSRSDEESIRLAAEAAVKAAVKSAIPMP